MRGARPPLDPFAPPRALVEEERRPEGGQDRFLTLFLVGAECPFGCVYCDLWRGTISGATPAGAIPRQIGLALCGLGEERRRLTGVKLYNASNYFDERAVPAADDPAVAALVGALGRVVVECHPRLVGPRAVAFARRLSGRLEVALGLETVHPEALARLGKAMTLADYDRATATLADAGIDHRAFVLVGAPYVPAAERVDWTLRSIDRAIERGARVVSLLPLRRGGEALEPLFVTGELAPPKLAEVEACLEPHLGAGRAVVQVDPWDLGLLGSCSACAGQRRVRIARLSASGRSEPPVACERCGGDS